MDVEGHVSDSKVQKALEALKEHCAILAVLGSYPKAVMGESA